MANLRLEGVCKGWDFPVIDELSLEVPEGEFFVIVGPSGIGKTTLLRLISGLEIPDAGSIVIGDKDVTRTPPYRRRVAMTFESYALYPHLSVFDNIASPLRARGLSNADIRPKVEAAAKLLRIDHLLTRKPGEVSGGQKQRTALGRTLVADPEVFLLDEPISHLDAKIRHELRSQFHTLEDLRKVATVYVTHDYAEALSLGDRIGVMGDGGKLVQVGQPRDLFERPAHLFVAEHLGQPTINILDGELSADALQIGSIRLPLSTSRLAALREKRVKVGIRPQHIRPQGAAAPGLTHIDALIDIFEPLGSVGVMIADAGGNRVTALTDPEQHFDYGQSVKLAIEHDAVLLFDPETGRNLEVA